MNYRDMVRSQRKSSRYDRNDETQRFENSKGWRAISHTVRQRNPLCQAIEDGEQCHKPSTQVHHLIAPEHRPDLRTDWSNLVALCGRHHISGKGDAGLFRYVPTIGFNDGEVYPHSGFLPLAPTARQRNLIPATGTPGAPLFVSRSVSAAKVDAALGTQDELNDLLAGF